jgi:hypothetical protein
MLPRMCVTDGIYRCLVGFLPCHCIPNCARYDGRVAQIVEHLSNAEEPAERRRSKRMLGACRAAKFLQNPWKYIRLELLGQDCMDPVMLHFHKNLEQLFL